MVQTHEFHNSFHNHCSTGAGLNVLCNHESNWLMRKEGGINISGSFCISVWGHLAFHSYLGGRVSYLKVSWFLFIWTKSRAKSHSECHKDTSFKLGHWRGYTWLAHFPGVTLSARKEKGMERWVKRRWKGGRRWPFSIHSCHILLPQGEKVKEHKKEPSS